MVTVGSVVRKRELKSTDLMRHEDTDVCKVCMIHVSCQESAIVELLLPSAVAVCRGSTELAEDEKVFDSRS